MRYCILFIFFVNVLNAQVSFHNISSFKSRNQLKLFLHCNYDTIPLKTISINTSNSFQNTSISTIVAYDYFGLIRIRAYSGFITGTKDTALAYQNLFNGSGNIVLNFDLPLFYAFVKPPKKKVPQYYAALLFSTRICGSLPGTYSQMRTLYTPTDFGLDFIANICGELNRIELCNIFRIALYHEPQPVISSYFSNGKSSFFYLTYNLKLRIMNKSFNIMSPLVVWNSDGIRKRFPIYAGATFSVNQ